MHASSQFSALTFIHQTKNPNVYVFGWDSTIHIRIPTRQKQQLSGSATPSLFALPIDGGGGHFFVLLEVGSHDFDSRTLLSNYHLQFSIIILTAFSCMRYSSEKQLIWIPRFVSTRQYIAYCYL
jgi:hypothetical protein